MVSEEKSRLALFSGVTDGVIINPSRGEIVDIKIKEIPETGGF